MLSKMRELSYCEALNDALREEMRRDSSVFIAGEDIGIYNGIFCVTQGLLEEFGPERIIDTPISEAAIMGLANGAAATGLRPVVELMLIDFATIAFDQIVNQAAKMCYMFGGKINLPLVVRGVCGNGSSSAAQHSQSLEALFNHIPGLKVVMPSTPADARGLLISSIRDENPVIFLEHSLLYSTKGPVPEGDHVVPLGKADIKRAGTDITIVAVSAMVQQALIAAEKLYREGIEAEVIDPRTLTPLDMDTLIDSVKKTNRMLIVHEAVIKGGIGSDIAALVTEQAFDDLDAPVRRLGAPFAPVPFSPTLEREYRPDTNKIVEAVKDML